MKRYTVTIDLYVYAENDEEVKTKAKEVSTLIDNIGGEFNDNKASVVSIHEAEFGKIEKGREVK